MKHIFRAAFVAFIQCLLSACETDSRLKVSGLDQPVELIRDNYGVNHIYAQNEHDLFFAQGYAAAKDRLFQFEIWRRQATGTVAEILGPRELKRDIGARLFKFRGDLNKEFDHYHPHGAQIITAFTSGINAYIEEVRQDTSLLTLEFKLLGILPQKWTPEVVISRHKGLLGNLPEEISFVRAVNALGIDIAKKSKVFEPGDPILDVDPKIKKELLTDSITELYNVYRSVLRFNPEDLISCANENSQEFRSLVAQDEEDEKNIRNSEIQNEGSNNWIVSSALSESGYPLLANDPHRAVVAPSLRYIVHLTAPGWNVVGGGEPTIPGVSIGHNENGAWGLTIFTIDGEDLYVYELNPKNQNQYKYKGAWEDFKIIQDTIKVKGVTDAVVTHRFTRHGPVSFVDLKNNVAYAVRCAWMEPGGAPYMASLRIDQAQNWDEFREGCSYSNIPGENMIWADKKGNIGWQVVGIAPVRKNWSGLVPVPGDGSYEWDGYLPIPSLPHVYNPPNGFWVTANENIVPPGYEYRNAVGWEWASRFRADRIIEVLGSGKKQTLNDMMQLQFDYLSLPARTLVPFLKDIVSSDPTVEEVRKMLLQWNFILDKNSVEAGIYVAWEKKISATILATVVPPEGKKFIKSIPLNKIIAWISTPDQIFGKDPVRRRNDLLIRCLQETIRDLGTKLGPDRRQWRYGQASYHHTMIKHPLSNALNEKIRNKLNLGPLPRGGNASTPGVTSNNDNQTHGATFRMVVDTEDWDRTMFTNTPGQSGDLDSPFYKNLFELWANDKHFPVYFSKSKIVQGSKEKIILTPKN